MRPNLLDIEYVQGLQSNLRASLGSNEGAEVILFLEEISGWYDFSSRETNEILINHGKRQILATIKTLLRLKPEEIVAIAEREQ